MRLEGEPSSAWGGGEGSQEEASLELSAGGPGGVNQLSQEEGGDTGGELGEPGTLGELQGVMGNSGE